MSVLSYLQGRASGAVLSEAERSSISTSISTLSSRLSGYFTVAGDGLSSKFQFGSSTRGTILPRRMDGQSDIDYMIVFQKAGFNPQTYLDRLKRFAQERYSTSELYQSNPTVVLELNHIKFDLVPALHQWGTYYKIPSSPTAWQDTNPIDFNTTLETANRNNRYLLKPTIRLAKLWNAANGYVYESYGLEKRIAGMSFWLCTNERDYLFSVFDQLDAYTGTQWRNDRINRAKGIVRQVREYERQLMPYNAEAEVKKLIPE
ncbi:SMODS domain-containing nucleotidyltransferase [Enterovirga aerilata]|uniref:Nucleotidyltransferase n=1 Tax=Enterovirga aerilata TaxID=2730920 RepID=A0A849HYA4_9HYPH|nr:nucleotidyltransferase [Enterovirga sp. DB1703]NNM72092.1 nucleotidyltransferase [Enterovirga sp. DB1703]